MLSVFFLWTPNYKEGNEDGDLRTKCFFVYVAEYVCILFFILI